MVGALPVAVIMVMVDVGLGPLATLVIANPNKPRVEFRRDLAVILADPVAGARLRHADLWKGRPLYYTFSVDRLELVAASDIDEQDMEAARKDNPAFVPGPFAAPLWVWAPLPENEDERKRIVESAVFATGKDVVQMPRYFKPYEQAHSAIRSQLKPIDEVRGLTMAEKKLLTPQVAEIGPADKVGAILFDGPSKSAVAVLDRDTLDIKAVLKREP
ncbi:MAG: hypothetical protein IPL03_13130 [Sterolibacteriaceae bacterium]|nr:hypothetical protein [Candidatus Methylophosphatis haderslevensis]